MFSFKLRHVQARVFFFIKFESTSVVQNIMTKDIIAMEDEIIEAVMGDDSAMNKKHDGLLYVNLLKTLLPLTE